MTTIIIVFGALTLLAGIVILVNPEIIFGFISKYIDKTALQVLAIVVRLALGVLLVYQSGASRYPLVIEVIGTSYRLLRHFVPRNDELIRGSLEKYLRYEVKNTLLLFLTTGKKSS